MTKEEQAVEYVENFYPNHHPDAKKVLIDVFEAGYLIGRVEALKQSINKIEEVAIDRDRLKDELQEVVSEYCATTFEEYNELNNPHTL